MKKSYLKFLLTLPLLGLTLACSGSGSSSGAVTDPSAPTQPLVTATQQNQPPTPPPAQPNLLDQYTDQYITYLHPNISADKRENFTQVIEAVWNRHLPGVDLGNFQENTDNLRNFFLVVYNTDVALRNDLSTLDAQVSNLRMDLKQAASMGSGFALPTVLPRINSDLSTLNDSIKGVQQKLKEIGDLYHVEITVPDDSDTTFNAARDQFSGGVMNMLAGGRPTLPFVNDPRYIAAIDNLDTLLKSISFCYKDSQGTDSSVSFMTFGIPKGQTLIPGTAIEFASGAVFGGFDTGDVDLLSAE